MTFQSGLLRALERRGRIKDISEPEALDALLDSGARVSVYAGFDPTADSLHAGHLATLSLLREFARAGHRAVAVVGTATALVGDPTGRTLSRPLLDRACIEENAAGVERSIRQAVSPFADRLDLRRNSEWFDAVGWITFLRDTGSLVPVRRVLALDGVRTRLESDGMSFLELAYPLMQAFDFLTLSRELGPLVQIGGSDQWGNICTGLDLIGKAGGGAAAFGMTHPLLVKADGTKMGKTAGGAVWLDGARLDAAAFFRFWRTLPDADAASVARLVSDMEWPGGPVDAVQAELLKEALAVEMTARMHGVPAAAAAREASRNRGRSAHGLPTTGLSGDASTDLAAALVAAGLAPSKGAARRLAQGGGVRVNGCRRGLAEMALGPDDFRDGVAVLSAGKTRHAAVRIGDDCA